MSSHTPTQEIDELPKSGDKSLEVDLFHGAARAVQRGSEFLFSVQRPDYYWCAELESNPTITSEYVFMCQMLGLDLTEKSERITRYLFGTQNADGSWGVAQNWDGDVSTSAEVYLALRILGVPPEHPVLIRTQKYILRNGGFEQVRIFTRIFFAMFGLMPWKAIPSIPPEFILLPPQSPVNIYSLSSWARGTMVPLFIIFHHQPVYALPFETSGLDHLWLDPQDKNIPYSSSIFSLVLKNRVSWKSLFGAADVFLKFYEKRRVGPVRERALKSCTDWVLQHQEKSGDWAGIFPPMLNGVIALTLRGFALDSEPVKKGIEAIERFSWEDPAGFRIQACNSPIWDTALSAISLIDSGVQPSDSRLVGAMKWVLDRQLTVPHGDWKVYRPGLTSGGWSFEYSNSWYPDVDDTAAVLLALLKQDPSSATGEPVLRAVEWTLGMQNRDGGWAAFDFNNDKLFLNEIPFSDMDSLCDPSSPDVTGRVIEAFGVLLSTQGISVQLRQRLEAANARALSYLKESQELQGAWFGRWGVNYVYGTSNVLCGLSQIRIPIESPLVERGIEWLKHAQNADGGWGESIASYADKRWMGKGESTPSQTAWALMGLLGYLPPSDPAITRGIRWLCKEQVMATGESFPVDVYEGGVKTPEPRGWSWEEPHFTGTGFPNHFYLRYNYYRHYFPMMALGRYIAAHMN